MKHILNNLSEEEKNSIREQHTDRIKIDTSKFKSLMESKLGDVKPLVEQSFKGSKVISESYREVEDLDNWIEANHDFISPNSLEEAVKEIFNLGGDVSSEKRIEKDNGGIEYGENWNKILITIKNGGEDLVKVWVNSDYRYAYGKNVSEFGERFYFNEYAL